MGSRQAGNEKAVAWASEAGDGASEGSFADAAEFGEVVVNATAGGASLEALEAAGAENLEGKVLIDVANALDFSQGMPPTLSVCNDDSLGERIQRAFPEARVVKALNTINASVMVSPGALGEIDEPVHLRERRGREGRGGRAASDLRVGEGADHRPRRHLGGARARRCTCRSGCSSTARSGRASSTSGSSRATEPRRYDRAARVDKLGKVSALKTRGSFGGVAGSSPAPGTGYDSCRWHGAPGTEKRYLVLEAQPCARVACSLEQGVHGGFRPHNRFA